MIPRNFFSYQLKCHIHLVLHLINPLEDTGVFPLTGTLFNHTDQFAEKGIINALYQNCYRLCICTFQILSTVIWYII